MKCRRFVVIAFWAFLILPAYAATTVEEPREFHALTELAKRQGWRRLTDTERDGTYLSERTVFHDTVTGCIIWRMTCDPAVDKDDYYDIPGWNANGSLMAFLTRRAGGTQRWLMNADGSDLRPMPALEGQLVRTGYWSVIYPDRFYHMIKYENTTLVVATNPFTGRLQTIVSVNRDLGSMMPPHPSEEWFLFGSRQGGTQDPSVIYVVGLDGSVQEIHLEKRWHRLRFTKSPDRRIFFNFDDPRTQWTVLPDGTDRTSIPESGGHPDWMPNGSELTYYTGGAIWAIRYDGTAKRRILELSSGGHGGPCRDGEWFVSDTPARGNYPGSILYLRTDGSEICHTIFRHTNSYYSHSVKWHPDHHSSHPHPNSSPDGTKSLFNVELLGQYTNIYVGVNRFPDPPQELQAQSEGTDVVLTWKKPRRSRETRGYHIYRSDQSGVEYHRLTDEPATGTQWQGPLAEPGGYYVVTAAEYSGLESRASNEVFGKGNENWQGPVRLAIEAETGQATRAKPWTGSNPTSSGPMREFIDQRTASDGYYIACLDEVAAGCLVVKMAVPKNALYYLWARVKGDGALTAGLRTKSWGNIQCYSQEWVWQKAQAAVELTAGEYELLVQPTTGSECLDKVLLTDDTAFVPEGMLSRDSTAPEAPTNLTAHALRPNVIRLTWSPVQAADIDHFNIYCSKNADFACEQASLVGSPSETEFVDWGLALNTGYRYKVTAIDRTGNESVPTNAVQADTVAFEPVRIELTRDNATLEDMRVIWIEAAGGKVLKPTSGQKGTAIWQFTIPRAGEYAIWGLSTHRENESSIFDLFLDEQAPVTWRVYGQWDKWLWSPAGNMTTGSPQLFTLTAGEHTLRVRTRTPTSSVAKIVVTDDPAWWPVKGMRK